MKYLLVLFSLVSTAVLCQEVKFSRNFTLNNTDISYKSLDSSQVNVYYSFTSSDTKNSDGRIYSSVCVLQLGNNFSKFVDVGKLKIDSLYQKFAQQGYAGSKELNILLNHKPVWTGTVFKNSKSDSLVRQNIISSKICHYEENPPPLDWQLINETKEILGYECRKATVKYRGRRYTAWYAVQLPLNDGPYIFKGLPGLILEIEDTNKYIHFKAEAINKDPMLIFLDESRTVIKSTRDKCRKFQENYFYNPSAFTQGKAYNLDGTALIPRPNTVNKYNPVEIE